MLNFLKYSFIFTAIGLFFGCNGEKTFSDLKGSWGGEHIIMNVTDTNAVIEYDCARGTMNKLIYYNADGDFEATGTHTLESGMVKAKAGREPLSVKYSGKVTGNKMEFTVYNIADGEKLASFDLELGKPGYLNKCQ